MLPSVVEITGKESAGSGVVYDNKGDIVTNDHVLGKAKTIEVLPATGTRLVPAKVLGSFPPDDLAVIRVERDAGSLKPARFVARLMRRSARSCWLWATRSASPIA